MSKTAELRISREQQNNKYPVKLYNKPEMKIK